MGQYAILGVRVVLVITLMTSVSAQLLFIPSIVNETIAIFPEIEVLRWPGTLVGSVLMLCVQVAVVCMWVLLTLVSRDSIFDRYALCPVNIMVGAFFGVALTAVAGFATLAIAGFGQPWVILVLLGIAIGGVGLALLMLVMRELLIRATRLDADLAEVI